MTHFLTLAITLSLAIAACADSHPSGEPASNSPQSTELVATPKAVPAVATVDSLAAAAKAPLAPAELAELVRSIEPHKTRNGGLRFSDPQLDTPAAAKLRLKRLQSAHESEAV